MDNLKHLLCDYYCFKSEDATLIDKINEEAEEYKVGDSTYLVCTEEGAESILQEYRNASISAAKLDIPEVYQDFFEFNEFADYTWQSLDDVYDSVNEVRVNDKLFYICLI